MENKNKNEDFEITPKRVFDLNLALYLDLVAALEGAGAITYRQMAARVLNISMDARADGESGLATALEGVAKGFAGQGGGLSIELLKAARSLREDDAMGDIPMRPDEAPPKKDPGVAGARPRGRPFDACASVLGHLQHQLAEVLAAE